MGKWKFPPDGGHMEKPTQIYLQTMTGLEVDERLKKNDLIILPIGSTEAHGAHACSGEDTFLVTRMAEAVAQKTGCTVAEPIWYGSHPYHHLGMPGTMVVPEETFIANLRAVMAGLWNAGFQKADLIQWPRAGLRDTGCHAPVWQEISDPHAAGQCELVVCNSRTHSRQSAWRAF